MVEDLDYLVKEQTSVTAAEVITSAQKLEDASAALYEVLAGKCIEHSERFLAYARDSRKNKVLVTRTYQETISDALEACYCFEGLRMADFAFNTQGASKAGYAETLQMALELEEQAIRFYLDVAKRSQSLLATIPQAFKRVAQKRNERKLELQSLCDS